MGVGGCALGDPGVSGVAGTLQRMIRMSARPMSG
jgi:hypothetical protein